MQSNTMILLRYHNVKWRTADNGISQMVSVPWKDQTVHQLGLLPLPFDDSNIDWHTYSWCIEGYPSTKFRVIKLDFQNFFNETIFNLIIFWFKYVILNGGNGGNSSDANLFISRKWIPYVLLCTYTVQPILLNCNS